MGIAIGMIEFSSIAKGIETSDLMVKAAAVEILRATTVCPGKYIVIVAGLVGDVNSSMEVGRESAGEFTVDTLLIPNVHPQLMPAISMTGVAGQGGAVGVIEYYSIASAILAADIAAKAADISLIEVKIGYAVGGKGVVIMTGDVDAVQEAVHAAVQDTELLVGMSIIPRLSSQVFETLL